MHARAMPGAEKDAQSHLRIDASILLCTGVLSSGALSLCVKGSGWKIQLGNWNGTPQSKMYMHLT